jgi:hypothetical protein
MEWALLLIKPFHTTAHCCFIYIHDSGAMKIKTSSAILEDSLASIFCIDYRSDWDDYFLPFQFCFERNGSKAKLCIIPGTVFTLLHTLNINQNELLLEFSTAQNKICFISIGFTEHR